ncbi:hypothetical protein EGH24_01905 [Halonotius terrestris]|uniref:Uncharacterized protein n=1 Tax=Halonotius terrestris TaxID=2487750 RepID=A0A8J8PBD0_9EURY|nr:hypothetical protein [Halonotius terrestris]TQQ83572.1 hypothetical protein EGH24_01905 [Halonotius terrestris]
MPSGSRLWSVATGGYACGCAVLLLVALSPITATAGSLLDLPTGVPPVVVFAAPVFALGAVVWWGLVERPTAYTYLHGVAAGVATAVLAVAFWVLVFAARFGIPLVRRGDIVIGFVLVFALAVGSLYGLTAMYARGRLSTPASASSATASHAPND